MFSLVSKVFKARARSSERIVALKNILVDNEKEGVGGLVEVRFVVLQ